MYECVLKNFVDTYCVQIKTALSIKVPGTSDCKGSRQTQPLPAEGVSVFKSINWSDDLGLFAFQVSHLLSDPEHVISLCISFPIVKIKWVNMCEVFRIMTGIGSNAS